MQKLSDWVKHRSHTVAGIAGILPALVRALNDSYVRPTPAPRTGSSTWEQSEAITVLCLLLVIFFGTLDYVVAPRIRFGAAFMIIVMWAAWSGGRKGGMFIAFMSVMALLVHEVRVSADEGLASSQVWNLFLALGALLFGAYVVSGARQRVGRLEWRVKERSTLLDHEISDRRQTEEQLRKTMQQFRQMAENISDAFWMRDATEARMAYVSPAYENIWGRSCRELYQFPQRWLEAIHPEDRERVAQAMYTRQAAGEYSQEYRIVRPDGSLRWIRDRAFPIRDSAGKVIRIVGIAEDITERRRLEREILEISDREQARIGQDLHDSLCQKLISIAFDHNSLEQKLAARSLPEVASVQQMGDLLDDTITEARALARGLFPVQLETNGLSLALEQLAANVNARAKVNCRMECPKPVSVRDNAVAMQLYRIAQEAVNNAVKHGNAKTIAIQLTANRDLIELNVTDDGAGIPAGVNFAGMGLHIMNYRARTIGGTLSINTGPNGGTVVSCVVHEPAEKA